MNIYSDFRRTGRTLRMLRDLSLAVNSGKYCIVVCAHEKSRKELQRQFAEMIDGQIAGSKVYPQNGIGQASFESPGVDGFTFDWSVGRSAGAHRSCEYFMDHHAVEHRFGWAIQQWVNYSNPFDKPSNR